MSQAGRRYPRYQIEIALPVTCRRKEDGERVGGHGIAMNVSRGGLLVLLSAAVPVETLLSVEVQTATQRLTSDARVVRVEDPRPDGMIPHGLAFVAGGEGSELLPELFLLSML